MNAPRLGAYALVPLLLLGAARAPLPGYGTAPHNAQSRVVERYLSALRAADYPAAYALLCASERAYYGNVQNLRSVYAADDATLARSAIAGARGDDRGRVFFVRERLAYRDHRDDARRELDATVPVGVLVEHGELRIKEPGKPFRAFAANSSAEENGVRVTVLKVDFYPRRIDVVVRFTNLGNTFVTLLPYGKSVLRDDDGRAYRPLAVDDPNLTDRRLFEGLPLAPNARYTGALAFVSGRVDDPRRTLALTVSPALRDGGDLPFAVTVAIAPAP